ncbi:fused MFS/spermidine synthase [Fodinicola feengrottensis]|uniref:spermidine synthase n=1 Tax=Fodinicola feengrottensis TaxID=435914 RepID=UPI0031DE6ECC
MTATRGRGAADSARQPGTYPTDNGTAELSKDLDVPDGWLLRLDGVPNSYVDLDDPTRLEFEYVQWIGDVLDSLAGEGEPLDTVHLGGGGFTLPRYVAATRRASMQVVFEYDERLVELARKVLGLRTTPRLRVRVTDARHGLSRLGDARYDVVIRDAFVGEQVPAHLTTVEFAAEVRRVLRADGTYVCNTADRPPLPQLRREVATLHAVFRHVLVITEPSVLRGRRYGNLVLVASNAPLPEQAIVRRAARGAVAGRVLDTDRALELAGTATILTDPREPA